VVTIDGTFRSWTGFQAEQNTLLPPKALCRNALRFYSLIQKEKRFMAVVIPKWEHRFEKFLGRGYNLVLTY